MKKNYGKLMLVALVGVSIIVFVISGKKLSNFHNKIFVSAIPSDAVKYDGHSYKIFNAGLDWNDAKIYCESLGGHLVTITSGSEQAFVQDLIVNRGTKGYYWTGGVRNSNGDFVWITGEKFSYSNWYSGEPNNGFGDEDIITVYKINGMWNDVAKLGNKAGKYPFFNIENSGFICEWDD